MNARQRKRKDKRLEEEEGYTKEEERERLEARRGQKSYKS